MKKDKWILTGGAAFLGVGLVGTGFFLFGDILEPKPQVNQPEVTSKKSTAKETVKLAGAKGEIVRTPYLALISPVGYGAKEFPVEQSDTFREELLREAEGGEVDKILNKMAQKIEGYRFSEDENLKIAGIYADASFVRGLVGKSSEEMRKLLPESFKTPEMLALMPLYLPEEARRPLFEDHASLTPLNPGPWEIKDVRYITSREEADADESYQDNGVAISMFNVIDGLHRIHVIEMSRTDEPDIPVRAYIGELNNGKLVLNGYYVPDGIKHYYKDVAFFEKLDEEYLKPNEEHQKEQMEKDVKEGNIPDEVIDEFLNPTE